MDHQYISRDECRSIQLQLLDTIDRICKENSLQYYLAYGTLLGAVRHKGYIPWDDDIDVMMPRSDYETFCKLVKASLVELNDWMMLLDDESQGYFYPITKLVHKGTIAKAEDSLVEHGIWVDIFPVDNIPDNLNKRKRFIKNNQLLRAFIISMTTDFSCDTLGKKGLIKKILNRIARIIGRERVYSFYKSYMQKYSNESCEDVASLYGAYGAREAISKADLFIPADYEFEGKKYIGPKNADLYLSKLYGNYMELPPVEKRTDHKLKAWYI